MGRANYPPEIRGWRRGSLLISAVDIIGRPVSCVERCRARQAAARIGPLLGRGRTGDKRQSRKNCDKNFSHLLCKLYIISINLQSAKNSGWRIIAKKAAKRRKRGL